ncbi:hypothetical protein [Polaromonas sp. CG9_12]|nr:hypothetical protein [Polaromonas sp. CG9_12]
MAWLVKRMRAKPCQAARQRPFRQAGKKINAPRETVCPEN